MKYARYLWQALRGFRTSIAIRILAGTGSVALGLLMVWLSKRFIDETIRTGSRDDIARIMAFLVLTMVGTIVLRLVYYYMTASAMVKKVERPSTGRSVPTDALVRRTVGVGAVAADTHSHRCRQADCAQAPQNDA